MKIPCMFDNLCFIYLSQARFSYATTPKSEWVANTKTKCIFRPGWKSADISENSFSKYTAFNVGCTDMFGVFVDVLESG